MVPTTGGGGGGDGGVCLLLLQEKENKDITILARYNRVWCIVRLSRGLVQVCL